MTYQFTNDFTQYQTIYKSSLNETILCCWKRNILKMSYAIKVILNIEFHNYCHCLYANGLAYWHPIRSQWNQFWFNLNGYFVWLVIFNGLLKMARLRILCISYLNDIHSSKTKIGELHKALSFSVTFPKFLEIPKNFFLKK